MRSMKEYAVLVEARLDKILPDIKESVPREGKMPALLAQSMRYSLLAGGKRLRPCMLLATYEMLGGKAEEILDFACAIEMIHTYSLIHDDLPGMDNDVLRRGRPTNHVVYGVGQAILAGDGLLNFAVETMLAHALRAAPEKAQAYLRAISEVMTGAGVTGMIAGQVIDLFSENNRVGDEKTLRYIQRDKTACMFIYPMRAAAVLADADEIAMENITAYADAFGRLFQATDDLLDVIGSSEEVGKTLGKDAEEGKLTCVSLYGLEGTKALVRELHDKACAAMRYFGEDGKLFMDLVDTMVSRTY